MAKPITPFHIKGKIQFPWKPTSDRVFIYPCPSPEKFIPGGVVEIPEKFRENYNQGIGVVLATGPGFFDKKGKWNGVPEDLAPGVYVKYNQDVPWKQVERAPDGNEYVLVLCGASDILGVVDFWSFNE